jgi:hypothetical protein
MSAFGSKTDIANRARHVCFLPMLLKKSATGTEHAIIESEWTVS